MVMSLWPTFWPTLYFITRIRMDLCRSFLCMTGHYNFYYVGYVYMSACMYIVFVMLRYVDFCCSQGCNVMLHAIGGILE